MSEIQKQRARAAVHRALELGRLFGWGDRKAITRRISKLNAELLTLTAMPS